MTRNDFLYNEALVAIKTLFEDMSVSKNETLCNLNALKEEIDILMSSLYDE